MLKEKNKKQFQQALARIIEVDTSLEVEPSQPSISDDDLVKRVAALETENKELRTRMEKLEGMLSTLLRSPAITGVIGVEPEHIGRQPRP